VGKDLQRLAFLNMLRPDVRTFLLIVSEGKLPNQFAWFADSENPDDITAARNPVLVQEIDAVVKVRRVCKAMSSVKSSAVHSAVLVEVISKR
jgi:hypothetical protein